MNGDIASNYPVTVVTVSFNSASPLRALLKTIPEKCPVIVVDNASEDDTIEVAEQFGAAVIPNEQNIGFGRACNKGADAAETEYLFFLNPDTELEPDTIDELYEATKRYPQASAFAPILLSQTGNPAMMSKSVLVPEKRWLPRDLPDTDFEVPAILGAAIFCRKCIFDGIGKFDEQIFLYGEDDDLSFRLRKWFGPIMIIRSAQLMHLGRQSLPVSMSTELGGFKRYHFHRSRMYVVRKHGVPFPASRKIIEYSLLFMISCLFFQRKLQIKYYFSVLGMLSIEDGNKYRIPRNLIAILARVSKLESLPRFN